MGDMNFDYRDVSFCNSKWKHLVELYDLQQVINCPTRATAHSETTIDHLYTSVSDYIEDVSVPCLGISDHYPICFTRTTSKKAIKRQSHKNIQYRSYANFDETKFLEELSREQSFINISHTDSAQNFLNWQNIFTKILCKHAPLKETKESSAKHSRNDSMKISNPLLKSVTIIRK